MKNISLTIAKSLIVLSFLFAPLAFATGASAQVGEKEICEGSGGTWAGTSCTTKGNTIGQTIQNITNIFLFIIGAVSIIMIIVGGFKYSTSAGDSTKLTAAKNTILYAIVGIVVSFGAYAIVNFVLTQLDKAN